MLSGDGKWREGLCRNMFHDASCSIHCEEEGNIVMTRKSSGFRVRVERKKECGQGAGGHQAGDSLYRQTEKHLLLHYAEGRGSENRVDSGGGSLGKGPTPKAPESGIRRYVGSRKSVRRYERKKRIQSKTNRRANQRSVEKDVPFAGREYKTGNQSTKN